MLIDRAKIETCPRTVTPKNPKSIRVKTAKEQKARKEGA